MFLHDAGRNHGLNNCDKRRIRVPSSFVVFSNVFGAISLKAWLQ